MAKEKTTNPEKEAKKLAKAEKKAKRSETDGVHKSSSEKKEKKEKKEKRKKSDEAADVEITTNLLDSLEDAKPGSVAIVENGDIELEIKQQPLQGALVPFANPLADEKVCKKVLKSVKKGSYSDPTTLTLRPKLTCDSRQEQNPQTGCERGRQSPAQIQRCGCPRWRSSGYRYTCCRHIANGCHITHSRPMRRSWRPIHLRHLESRAWRSREYEATDQRGLDQQGSRRKEKGREDRGRR